MNDIQKTVERAKQGDHEAFSLLYSEYYVPVYRYIYARVKRKEQTEDLVQDVFVKIYKSVGSLNPQAASPLAYFYTIARNTLIDHWRKKTIQSESDDEFLASIPDPSPTALEAARLREDADLLRACLSKLTAEQQEAVTLRYVSELSNKEIAAIMDKNETAVRQLQVRALRTLGKLFNEQHEK